MFKKLTRIYGLISTNSCNFGNAIYLMLPGERLESRHIEIAMTTSCQTNPHLLEVDTCTRFNKFMDDSTACVPISVAIALLNWHQGRPSRFSNYSLWDQHCIDSCCLECLGFPKFHCLIRGIFMLRWVRGPVILVEVYKDSQLIIQRCRNWIRWDENFIFSKVRRFSLLCKMYVRKVFLRLK